MLNTKKALPKRVAIGSDHVGYDLKENIKLYLVELGIEVRDIGTTSRERTDYPLFARQVAENVRSKEAELGILICGTGIGMAIAANKIRGIRAAACSEPYSAALSRQHNNSNVLTFGAMVVGSGLARMIVEAWLYSEYEGGRHTKRVEMIADMENNLEFRVE
jgi:ribose 5-phosphate isomerase B